MSSVTASQLPLAPASCASGCTCCASRSASSLGRRNCAPITPTVPLRLAMTRPPFTSRCHSSSTRTRQPSSSHSTAQPAGIRTRAASAQSPPAPACAHLRSHLPACARAPSVCSRHARMHSRSHARACSRVSRRATTGAARVCHAPRACSQRAPISVAIRASCVASSRRASTSASSSSAPLTRHGQGAVRRRRQRRGTRPSWHSASRGARPRSRSGTSRPHPMRS